MVINLMRLTGGKGLILPVYIIALKFVQFQTNSRTEIALATTPVKTGASHRPNDQSILF